MKAHVLQLILRVADEDVAEFAGADIMAIPHAREEREGLLCALADLERYLEASGDAQAIAAFRAIGAFLERAKFTSQAREDA